MKKLNIIRRLITNISTLNRAKYPVHLCYKIATIMELIGSEELIFLQPNYLRVDTKSTVVCLTMNDGVVGIDYSLVNRYMANGSADSTCLNIQIHNKIILIYNAVCVHA